MSSSQDAPKRPPEKQREDEKLDQAIDDSFPASDPLPISPTTTGAPRQANGAKRERKTADARKR